MSVFTMLQRAELEPFVAAYGLGRLLDFQGIAEGTENSNFFVSMEAGDYVLTLVERGDSAQLGFVIKLLDMLHEASLPVPFALRTRSNVALGELAGKPALLQPRLPGRHIMQPNRHHCTEIGRALARLHLATRATIIEHEPERGLDWMLQEGQQMASQLQGSDLVLLNGSLHQASQLRQHWFGLPRANLHADLFRDNVLFDGPHLSGLIDFYNACSGPMLYDLAIAVIDWCSDIEEQMDESKVRALLGAYAALRPFTTVEARHWPTMRRIACLRFWLSRLIAVATLSDNRVLIKDPEQFRQRLMAHQNNALALPFML